MKEIGDRLIKSVVSVLIVLSMLLTGMVVIVATVPSNASAETYTDFTIGVASSNMTVTNGSTWIKVNTEEYQIYVNWSGPGTNSVVWYFIRPYFTTNEIFFRRGLNLPQDGNATYNVDYITSGGTSGGLDSIGTVISGWGQSGNKISFNESCDTPARYYINQTYTIYRDYMEMNVTYVPGTDTIVTNYAMCLADSTATKITARKYIPGSIDNPPTSVNTGGWYNTETFFAPCADFRDVTNMGVEWGFNDTACYIRFPYWTAAGLMGGGGSVLDLRYCHSNSIMEDIWNVSGQTFHSFIRPYEFNDGQSCGHCVGYAQWEPPLIANYWGNHGHDDTSFPQFVMDLNQWNHTQAFGMWLEQNSSIKVATYTLNTNQVDWNYKAAFAPNIAGPDNPYGTLTAVNSSWWVTYSNGTAFHGKPWSGDPNLVYKCNPSGYNYTDVGSFMWNMIANDSSSQVWWEGSGGVFYDMADSVDSYGSPISDYSNHTGNLLEGVLELIKNTWEAAATPQYNWTWVIVNTGYGADLHVAMAASRDVCEALVPSTSWTTDKRSFAMSADLFIQNIPAAYRPRLLYYQYYGYDHSKDYRALYDAVRMSIQYHFDLVPLDAMNSFAHKLQMYQAVHDLYYALGASVNSSTTITPAWINVTTTPVASISENYAVLYAGEGVTPQITFLLPPHGIYNVTNLNHTARNLQIELPTNTEMYVVGTAITSPTMTFFDTGDSEFEGSIAADADGSIVPYDGINVYQSSGQANITLVNNTLAASTLIVTGTAGQYTTINVGNMVPSRVYGVYIDGTWMENVQADAGGVVSTLFMYNSTHTLLISDPLAAGAIITSDVSAGVKPFNVTFDSSVSGGVPPYSTYWWNFGDGNSSVSGNMSAAILGNWTKYGGNPTLTTGSLASWDSVVNVSGTYHMYYSYDNGGFDAVGHATSADGINWTIDVANNPVLPRGLVGTWDRGGVWCPMVWIEGTTWYMIYTGMDSAGNNRDIGLATSADGISWSKYGSNPVLTGTLPWEMYSGFSKVESYGIMKVGSTYYLWYNTLGSPNLGTTVRQQGLATSTDLTNWSKDVNNPVFSNITYPYGCFCSFPFKYGSYYYLTVPHYTATTSNTSIDLWRDAYPTFYSADRTLVGTAISRGTAGTWDAYNLDTAYVLTDNVNRTTFNASHGALWCYYAGEDVHSGTWATGMTIDALAPSSSLAESVVYSYADVGNYSVQLTVNDSNGTPIQSNILNIQVLNEVPPIITITSNVTTGSYPLNVSFTSFINGGTAPYTYWWNFGDGNTSSAANISHTYASIGVYNAQLTVNDSGGASIGSNTITIIVSNMGVSISSDVVGGSTPLLVSFTPTISGGTGPFTYFWTFGDGNSSVSASVSYYYNATGTYFVGLIVNDSLGSSATSNMITIDAINTGGPGGGSSEKIFAANFRYDANSLVVTFTDTSYSLNYPVSDWFWNFGDGTASEAKNPIHTYSFSGTYRVQLWVNNTAGESKTVIKEVTVQYIPLILSQSFWAQVTSSNTMLLIAGAALLTIGVFVPKSGRIGILFMVLGALVLFVWWMLTFGINLH